MSDHLLMNGEDLMEKVFEKLTSNKIEIFEIQKNGNRICISIVIQKKSSLEIFQFYIKS